MVNNRKIVLASKSERRKEILKKHGFDFEVITSDVKEKDIVGKKYSEDLVNECAKEKAKNVYNEFFVDKNKKINQSKKITERQNSESAEKELPIIISCDTVVVNDGIIIGKPKDKNDAVRILKSLSDKTHIVASSVCIIKDGDVKVAHEITRVTFRKITDKEINDYIERCRPFDKAGSYGIQDPDFDFDIRIDGEIDNVIGFPMKAFYSIL